MAERYLMSLWVQGLEFALFITHEHPTHFAAQFALLTGAEVLLLATVTIGFVWYSVSTSPTLPCESRALAL